VFPEAVAALSGLNSVPDGTPVQLVRIDDAGNVAATLASTSVIGGRYSFNLTSLGLSPASNLAVRVVNPGTGAQLRAFVSGTTVDLDPISETAVRLVLERIALTPGTTLNQFTVTELRDIAGATNQLAIAKQLTAGLNIEATVSAIKTAVASDTGLTGFILAAAGPGETPEGPGDIGNYLPLTQGNTWQFQGTHSETGQPTVQFSNIMTVNGTKPIGPVTTTILAESNPLNSGAAEEIYYLKDSRGLWNYGNSDSSDSLSSDLVPYREVLFPLNLGVTTEVVNKKRVNYGQDLDSDGKNETADVLSQVTVETFETVTVPKGTFANAAKVVQKTTITVVSSAGLGSVKVVGIQTVWFAHGIGPIKRQIVMQADGKVATVSEELTDHYARNLGNAIVYSTNGQSPTKMTIVDFNADGRNDVASNTHVYLQNSQGSLNINSPVVIDPGQKINMLNDTAVGDLNGDGRSDVVLAGRCAGCDGLSLGVVDVRYQDPETGALVQGPQFSWLGTGVNGAAIGDINSDGRKDLLIIAEEGQLRSFYQLNNGRLGTATTYDQLTGARGDLHITDIDNDGDNDIIVQNDYRKFAIIKQTAGGLSNVPKYYSVPTHSIDGFEDMAVGDINGDERHDIVVAAQDGLFLYLQNGVGELNSPIHIAPLTNMLARTRITDINIDGLNDVVQAGVNEVYVYLQTPNHSLDSPRAYRFQTATWGGDVIAVGDVTGDTKSDVVVVRGSSGLGPEALYVIPNITH
jgi:hypothetical protein